MLKRCHPPFKTNHTLRNLPSSWCSTNNSVKVIHERKSVKGGQSPASMSNRKYLLTFNAGSHGMARSDRWCRIYWLDLLDYSDNDLNSQPLFLLGWLNTILASSSLDRLSQKSKRHDPPGQSHDTTTTTLPTLQRQLLSKGARRRSIICTGATVQLAHNRVGPEKHVVRLDLPSQGGAGAR